VRQQSLPVDDEFLLNLVVVVVVMRRCMVFLSKQPLSVPEGEASGLYLHHLDVAVGGPLHECRVPVIARRVQVGAVREKHLMAKAPSARNRKQDEQILHQRMWVPYVAQDFLASDSCMLKPEAPGPYVITAYTVLCDLKLAQHKASALHYDHLHDRHVSPPGSPAEGGVIIVVPRVHIGSPRQQHRHHTHVAVVRRQLSAVMSHAKKVSSLVSAGAGSQGCRHAVLGQERRAHASRRLGHGHPKSCTPTLHILSSSCCRVSSFTKCAHLPTCNAVFPPAPAARTLAPPANSASTTSTWPLLAAFISAVNPSLLTLSRAEGGICSSRETTVSVLPPSTAHQSCC
jgi:hypothetical protein